MRYFLGADLGATKTHTLIARNAMKYYLISSESLLAIEKMSFFLKGLDELCT